LINYFEFVGNDGAAFVLQTDTTSLGIATNGMGFRDVKPSVAISFDTHQDMSDNDPPYDHSSIQINGNTDHNNAGNLTVPVSIEPYYLPVFDGATKIGKRFHHLIEIKWDPSTTTLSSYIDGGLLQSVNYDLISKIFNNNPSVYWGFTASNTQEKILSPYVRF